MKRTYKSIGYTETTTELEKLEKERRARELWRYNYINRHILLNHLQHNTMKEMAVNCDNIEAMLNKYLLDVADPEQGNESEYLAQMLEFSSGLIYAYHRQRCADGYIDLKFEGSLAHYNGLVNKLTKEELRALQHLHTLSQQYGLSIIELYLPQDSNELQEAFINAYPDTPPKLPPYPIFSLPMVSNDIKGIQIVVGRYKSNINGSWNLAIFYDNEDTFSTVATQVKKSWDIEGEQIIGNKNQYDIVLYVDRSLCKRTYVLNALQLQIGWRNFEKFGRIAPLSDSGKGQIRKSLDSTPKNFLSNTIDAFKLSEGLTEKRWELSKGNIRRSIAINHWDELHAQKCSPSNYPSPIPQSRRSLIETTISQLKNKKPELLELYLDGHNNTISEKSGTTFGDIGKLQDTVIREMEYDYDMTDYCIKNANYFSPSQAKEGRRSSKSQ